GRVIAGLDIVSSTDERAIIPNSVRGRCPAWARLRCVRNSAPDHPHPNAALGTECHAAPLDRGLARLQQLELELAQQGADRDARLEVRERGADAAAVAAAERQVLVGPGLGVEEPLGLEAPGLGVEV